MPPGLLAFLQASFFLQLTCNARCYQATIIWPRNVIISVLSGTFCNTPFDIQAQFIIRKEEPTVLARRASYAKKTLARQVVPLAQGYRTALLSRPELDNRLCK